MSESLLVGILGTAVAMAGALLSFHAGRTLNNANAHSINAKTLIELSDKVRELTREVIEIHNELDDVKDKNHMLWAYVYQLLDGYKKNDITPPEPPAELKDDAQMSSLLKWINEK
jgi:hypothetical protein